MNWAYYSHYVGDVFGAPLAIEGLMAFFLEATFVGLFFFGWDRLSARVHLAVTWLMALGTNFSALWPDRGEHQPNFDNRQHSVNQRKAEDRD